MKESKNHTQTPLNINIKGKPEKVKMIKNVKKKGEEWYLPDSHL